MRWLRRLSASISATSAIGSTTAPLPITHILPGCKAPAGTRRRMNFSPLTTRVWAALLPPWKRTIRSASAASRSTILPLPSSPHCEPTTATVFIANVRGRPAVRRTASGRACAALGWRRGGSKLYLRGGGDRRNSLETFEQRGRHRAVDFEQAECGATSAIAAEFEPGDVDP